MRGGAERFSQKNRKREDGDQGPGDEPYLGGRLKPGGLCKRRTEATSVVGADEDIEVDVARWEETEQRWRQPDQEQSVPP